MKKQFFYAAMALAVMSSCSKDNDPGIGNPDDNNDKAVIALGVRLCQNADTAFFYAQSPDFLKPGLCYYPKFSYL